MTRRISLVTSFLAVMLLIYFAEKINQLIPHPALENQDIYYSYVEGKRLTEGKNPYGRIIDGDMRENKKYATYFPVFYELSYLSQKMGLNSYLGWIQFWGVVFTIFEFGITLLIYMMLARNRLEWVGVFAAAFWLFNRWTLKLVEMVNLDFIPIFFLLLSLAVFSKNKWASLVLFSLSLGFKQVAIFLAPLYLIWTWQDAGRNRIASTLLAGLAIVSVPLISGLPFLIWNAQGFIMSVMFSATRFAADQFGVPSMDVIIGWEGLAARLGMLVLMGAVYLFSFQGYCGRFFSSFMIMSVFLDFNSVLFAHYPAWVIPLAPMMFLEFQNNRGNPDLDTHKTLPA